MVYTCGGAVRETVLQAVRGKPERQTLVNMYGFVAWLGFTLGIHVKMLVLESERCEREVHVEMHGSCMRRGCL